MSAVARASLPAGPVLPLPADILSELECTHERLLACVAEMDEVTRQCEPDALTFTRARFRISNASLKRRQLFNTICAKLMPRLSTGDASRLQSVRQADFQLLKTSGVHVARWPSDAIGDDWIGYCRASRAIRAKMIEALGCEMRTLSPMLQRHGLAGRRSVQMKGK